MAALATKWVWILAPVGSNRAAAGAKATGGGDKGDRNRSPRVNAIGHKSYWEGDKRQKSRRRSQRLFCLFVLF